MPTGLPHEQGLSQGIGFTQLANVDEPFLEVSHQLFGYAMAQPSNHGQRDTAGMSFMQRTRTGVRPIHWSGLYTPVNVDQRRRSSQISPRTLQAMTYSQSHTSSTAQTQAVSSLFTEPVPAASIENNDRAQQQVFERTYPSSISSGTSIETTTASTINLTPSDFHFYVLLSEICTEAVRRKWQEETQRRLMNVLAARRSYSRSRLQQHRLEPYRRPVRFSTRPGYSSSAPTRARMASNTGVGMGTGTAPPQRLMDYVRLMANTLWETADLGSNTARTRRSGTNAAGYRGAQAVPDSWSPLLDGDGDGDGDGGGATLRREIAALQEMSTLYALAGSVYGAVEAVRRGWEASTEEVRELVARGRRLCALVGYEEGERRVEMLGRCWVGPEAGIL